MSCKRLTDRFEAQTTEIERLTEANAELTAAGNAAQTVPEAMEKLKSENAEQAIKIQTLTAAADATVYSPNPNCRREGNLVPGTMPRKVAFLD